MKNKILIAIAALLITGGAYAVSPKESPNLDRIIRALDIQPDQQEAVEKIFQEQRESHETLHEKHQLEREAHKEQTKARLSEVLTPEQMLTFENMKKKRHNGKHRKGKHGEGKDMRGKGKNCGAFQES